MSVFLNLCFYIGLENIELLFKRDVFLVKFIDWGLKLLLYIEDFHMYMLILIYFGLKFFLGDLQLFLGLLKILFHLARSTEETPAAILLGLLLLLLIP